MKTKRPEIKSHPYDILLYLLVGIILVGLTIVILTKDSKPRANIHTEQAKNYELRSEQMHMKIFYPSDMVVDDDSPNVIKFANKKGMITVSRIATNFRTVKEHFDLLKIRNHLNVVTTTSLTINQYDSLLTIMKQYNGDLHRTYFIYSDHWVYSISTANKALYTIQDAMTDSFRYTSDNQ